METIYCGLLISNKGVKVPAVLNPKKLRIVLVAENTVLLRSSSFLANKGLTSTKSRALNLPKTYSIV